MVDEVLDEAVEALPPVERSVVQEQIVQRLDLARTERQPHLDRWLKFHALYLNEYDFSGKEPWQSKGYVPSLSRALSFVADTAKSALVENRDNWATADGSGSLGKLAAPILLKLAYDCLERSGFMGDLKPNIKAGLLTPGILWKVSPVGDGGLYPGDTRVSPVDYRLVIKDPSGRGKYLYHVDCYDYADVVRMARDHGWDMAAVELLRQEDGSNADPDEAWRGRFAQMTGTRQEGQYRKAVYLAEYYGPIHDSAGNEIYRFAYTVIANARVILMDPVEQPFGDDEGCIVGSDLDERLGAPYGKAFAEDAAGLAENLTRLFNAFLDGAVYDMIPVLGVNKSLLVDKKQLDGGLRPGRTVFVNGNPSEAIQRLETGNQRPGEGLAVWQVAQQEFQSATSATDISRGVPAARGTKEQTLGEFQLKDSANQRTLSSLAVDMEDCSFAPMFQRLMTFIGRAVDLSHPEVRKVAGREIDEAVQDLVREPETEERATAMLWPPWFDPRTGMPLPPDPERLQQAVAAAALSRLQEACQERFEVRVRGISAQLSKREQAAAALTAMSALMQTPGAAALDWEKIPRLMAEVNGIDPDDLLLDEEEREKRKSEPPPPPEWLVAFVTSNFQNLAPAAQGYALQMLGFPEDVVAADQQAAAVVHMAPQNGMDGMPPMETPEGFDPPALARINNAIGGVGFEEGPAVMDGMEGMTE